MASRLHLIFITASVKPAGRRLEAIFLFLMVASHRYLFDKMSPEISKRVIKPTCAHRSADKYDCRFALSPGCSPELLIFGKAIVSGGPLKLPLASRKQPIPANWRNAYQHIPANAASVSIEFWRGCSPRSRG